MFGFTLFKTEIEEIQGPSIQSKGLDKSQMYLSSIEFKEILSDKPNILLMDDDSFWMSSLKRDLKQLHTTINDQEEMDEILKYILESYGTIALEHLKKFISNFDINNYNIISYTGIKCGFEVLKSIESTKSTIDFAILDIVLGGIVIDENNAFISVDGIDVAHKLLEKYNNSINILISTGCSLKKSKEEYKLNDLIGKKPNVNIYIKGLDIAPRLGNILLLLSGYRFEE